MLDFIGKDQHMKLIRLKYEDIDCLINIKLFKYTMIKYTYLNIKRTLTILNKNQ